MASPFIVKPLTNIVEAADLATGPYEANNPLVGYDTIVPSSIVTPDFEDTDFPVSNLKNYQTNNYWLSTELYDQSIEVIFPQGKNIDYVGIARHNFNSDNVEVSVDVANTVDSVGDPQYTEAIAQTPLGTDGPILFRFNNASRRAVRLNLYPDAQLPQLAILFVGKLLVIERRLYVGHTPITMGREINAIDMAAISGDYLGSVVLGEARSTAVQLNNLTPSWYRQNMDPFMEACHSQKLPFFWAWRPATYPDEVGFGWITDDPHPTNTGANGLMGTSWNMQGII